jgi:hypothetical protein
MKLHSAPRMANWLLSCFLTARDREEVRGDLVEEFQLRTQSPGAGWFWYWGQVLRSIPPIVWNSVRPGCWIRTLAVALAAYIVAGVIEFVADAALSRLLSLDATVHTVLSLIIGLATMLASGYIAARLRPGANAAMGVIVAIAVAALMAAQAGHVPLWYQIAFLFAGPFSVVAGGALFARRKA